MPKPIQRRIKGIGGNFNAEVYTTTISWELEDDDGVATNHVIPHSSHIPDAPNSLFSPQHWAQHQRSMLLKPRCTTYADYIVLEWDNCTKCKTITLDIRGSNVGVMRTIPGFTAFSAFCKDTGCTTTEDDATPITVQATVIPDDDESTTNDQSAPDLDDEHPEEYFPAKDTPLSATAFNLDGPVHLVSLDGEDTMPQDASAELLRYHHRYGHAPMHKLQQMTANGNLPARLSTCRVPLFTSCLYGKATCKAWRDKLTTTKPLCTITKPGQCISVDQLTSTTPGLVAQSRGKATTKQYMVATIFVNHYSGLSFTHLHKSTSVEETIQGKEKFEAYTASCNVQVVHYHADNGIFANNKFGQAVSNAKQTLSFCGIITHFQNGVVERRIRELQDNAQTMLIHMAKRWPMVITTHLWPYALHYSNDMFNNTLNRKKNFKTPMELFSGSKVSFNPKHAHTSFGCPVYVLDSKMQQGRKIDKWSEQSRVEIFLGYSPQHAQSVSLVLSLTSGLTLPQLHMEYDNSFQTLCRSFGVK